MERIKLPVSHESLIASLPTEQNAYAVLIHAAVQKALSHDTAGPKWRPLCINRGDEGLDYLRWGRTNKTDVNSYLACERRDQGPLCGCIAGVAKAETCQSAG